MGSKMQAAVTQAYGGPEVIRVRTLPRPVPKANQVLVKVSTSTVSSADSRLRRADPAIIRLVMGLTKPRKKVLGNAFAGRIAAVGEHTEKFKVDDEVFGTTDFRLGAHAEYIRLKETALILHKPTDVNFESACTIPFGFTTALHFLRRAHIRSGQKVLIIGASGALGTAAVQLAQYFGAEVTGVCGPKGIKTVQSLGANQTVDYTKQHIADLNSHYDIIFDTVGKLPLGLTRRLLKKQGRYVSSVHINPKRILQSIWISLTTDKKVRGGVYTENIKDLTFLKKLFEQGELKAVIGKSFALKDIAKAHAYIDSHDKVGNAILHFS